MALKSVDEFNAIQPISTSRFNTVQQVFNTAIQRLSTIKKAIAFNSPTFLLNPPTTR
jgi:hypothetical protein